MKKSLQFVSWPPLLGFPSVNIPDHLLHLEEDRSKYLAAMDVSVISMGLFERDQGCIHLFSKKDTDL